MIKLTNMTVNQLWTNNNDMPEEEYNNFLLKILDAKLLKYTPRNVMTKSTYLRLEW